MMGMIKRAGGRMIVFALSVSALVLLMGFSCFATEDEAVDHAKVKQRVFDQGELLDSGQEEELEQKIQEARAQIKMDLVILTTSNAKGKTARAFADDFYDQGNFGTGTEYSGALFLIDMDNREIWISTSGKMIRYLTDERVEGLLDTAYDSVSGQFYQQAALGFIDGVQEYCDEGIETGQFNYDTETGRISTYQVITPLEGGIAVICALIAALVPCIVIKSRYGMKNQRRLASRSLLAYQGRCGFSYQVYADDLVHKSVTQRVIPKKTTSSGGSSRSGSSRSSGRSTTHRSSSGRSHGGGGRKF